MNPRLAVAFLLPLAMTGLTVGEVAWNRSGGRDAIGLTEREVYTLPTSDERSAPRVWLMWQTAEDRDSPFSREKLASLGFNTTVDPASAGAERHYDRLLPRQVWVAFELAGPSYDRLRREPNEKGSRLVAIDADTDVETLAARYPDAARYLITAAIVRATRIAPRGERPYVIGTVQSVSPRRLYVPREFASSLRGATFTVSVRYGRRFEPWVVEVRSHKSEVKSQKSEVTSHNLTFDF